MSAYLSAALTILASLIVGAALSGGARRQSWTAPAVGAAALMLVALLTIRLPGHGQTAAAACAVDFILPGEGR